MGFHSSQGQYHAFRASILLSLGDFLESVSGDTLNAAGNGGLLASDSTPARSGTGATVSQQLSWVTGNVDQILTQIALPEDFDGREDVFIELWVNSGTSDAATFTVLSSWDGGADVTDTASDAATKSATTHKITAVISAADIPDAASFVSIGLTPGAHATNAIQLVAARLSYVRRIS